MNSEISKISRPETWICGRFTIYLKLRFLDLDDPPLDFTAWRQLRSATIARGMYYDMLPDNGNLQQSLAISLGKSFEKLEPEIFERIVALSYLLIGKEILPIARVWAIIF